MSVVFTKKIARSLSGAETKGFESKERGVNLWNVSAVWENGQKKWCLAAMRQREFSNIPDPSARSGSLRGP